jgi:hypothetical protein
VRAARARAWGTDPPTTGLANVTEPGSGSAIVRETARLGLGSVW